MKPIDVGRSMVRIKDLRGVLLDDGRVILTGYEGGDRGPRRPRSDLTVVLYGQGVQVEDDGGATLYGFSQVVDLFT